MTSDEANIIRYIELWEAAATSPDGVFTATQLATQFWWDTAAVEERLQCMAHHLLVQPLGRNTYRLTSQAADALTRFDDGFTKPQPIRW